MQKSRLSDNTVRYIIATVGIILVAMGAAVSIKSNFGTAPITSPPYMIFAWSEKFTVGQYTMMMHFIFIISQIIMLRRRFELRYLMQIPAAIVFGLITDFCIWTIDATVPATALGTRIGLCILSLVLTALGVTLEVIGNAWMLAGEMTTKAVSIVTRTKFSSAKVGFDTFLVLVSMAFGWLVFHNLWGSEDNTVIWIGTLVSALCTGLVMKLTEPLCHKLLDGLMAKWCLPRKDENQ